MSRVERVAKRLLRVAAATRVRAGRSVKVPACASILGSEFQKPTTQLRSFTVRALAYDLRALTDEFAEANVREM